MSTTGDPINPAAAGPAFAGPTAPRKAAPILLTIAGFDPTSGAGLTADLKVFAAHRCYGVAAATALTVQSTCGVDRVEPVSSGLLAEMLRCLSGDLPLAGIKIGMLATLANVDTVSAFLEDLQSINLLPFPVVLDPILASSSGHCLLGGGGLDAMRARLLPLVTCITPNSQELFALNGRPASAVSATREQVMEASAMLASDFPKLGIVATGGHLASPDDLVLAPGQALGWLSGEWVHTSATHGTGCAYASALLCALVAGRSLFEGARAAKLYVTAALLAAEPIGHGGGSMHHLYAAFGADDR